MMKVSSEYFVEMTQDEVVAFTEKKNLLLEGQIA